MCVLVAVFVSIKMISKIKCYVFYSGFIAGEQDVSTVVDRDLRQFLTANNHTYVY